MDVSIFYREMEKREEEEKKDEKEEKKKEKIKNLKELKTKKKEKKEKELKEFNLEKKKERAYRRFLNDINLRGDDNEEFLKMKRNRVLRFPSFDVKEEERKKKEKNEEKKKIYHWKKELDIKSFSSFLEKKRNERL